LLSLAVVVVEDQQTPVMQAAAAARADLSTAHQLWSAGLLTQSPLVLVVQELQLLLNREGMVPIRWSASWH
jgi:hypothetical protein